MGIRKSKITPSINVDDMLKKVEISHETETEKLDVEKTVVIIYYHIKKAKKYVK